MKRVVVRVDVRESQIRPESGFSTYISLLEEDFKHFLGSMNLVPLAACPACESSDSSPDFAKMGLEYRRCGRCQTSYATPRPSMEDLDRFYDQSEAIRYWTSYVMSKATAPARRQFIFGPRATWVLETSSIQGKETGVLVDFFSRYPAYLEEIVLRGRFAEILAHKPSLEVQGDLAEASYGQAGALEDSSIAVASAFEVLERLFDPFAFLEAVNRALEPGGLVFLTTVSISGFDLSLLRERARSLLPPTHLTLPSYEGIQILMDRSGFEVLELSTPGQLDVALVLDAVEKDPTIELPEVISSILLNREERIHEAFQDFLQQANLSSHVWVAARKRPEPRSILSGEDDL